MCLEHTGKGQLGNHGRPEDRVSQRPRERHFTEARLVDSSYIPASIHSTNPVCAPKDRAGYRGPCWV